MRVLGDFDIDPHPDISIRKAHPADRWLLCSDGLCGVLEDSTIKETMTALADQGECAQRLVQMALRAGSTDNVTAVIADATLALDADASICHIQTPLVGGAAAATWSRLPISSTNRWPRPRAERRSFARQTRCGTDAASGHAT